MKRNIILSLIIYGVGIACNAQTLSLDSCKTYALENNKKLKEALLKCDEAEQVRKNAFTNYFPTVNASVMAMKANKGLIEGEIPEMNLPVYDGNPVNLENPTLFTYFPGMSLELLDYANAGMLSAVQPVYAGGRIRNGNKLAALGEEFSEHQLNLTTDEVLVATEYYYWTILALKEKKKTLEEYEKLLNSLLNDVNVAYEAGLIHKSDLLKVQLELNNIEANKIKLENALSLLKMTLAQHIGTEYSESFDIIDTSITVNNPATLFYNPEDALLNRDEYQMLNKAIDVEILQKKMARGEYMPSVAIGVQGLYLDIMDQNNNYGIAFVTVSIPISGWWGGSHKIQEHQIKVEVAQNNLEEKTELLKLQMDKAYKDLTESYKQIEVAESSVEQATEHLSVMKDSFDAGIVSTSDLLEAQAMFQKSQDSLVDAKTTCQIKLAEYLKTTGRL